MKIFNKTPSEIFAEMIWPYKIVVTVGILFLIFAVVYITWFLAFEKSEEPQSGPLYISGLNTNEGIFDPSVADDGDHAYVAYTVLRAGQNYPIAETAIAQGRTPSCQQWANIRTVIQSEQDELMGPDNIHPVESGTWQVETPSLVYDPDDKGREWKLYAYKYFWFGQPALARLYGFIVYKYASNPLYNWSTEEWVMSPDRNHPLPPYSNMIKTYLNDLNPALKDIYFYARPSVIYNKGLLMMSLSAFINGKTTADRIVIFISADHGKTWAYAGAPLSSAELSTLGKYTTLGGASLIQQKGNAYLAVVPGDETTAGIGTLFFPFEDVKTAKITRDPKTGRPLVTLGLPLQSKKPTQEGGGYAAYSENCKIGILTSEMSGLTGKYEIFKTYQTPSSASK